jgi:hypothetical protein
MSINADVAPYGGYWPSATLRTGRLGHRGPHLSSLLPDGTENASGLLYRSVGTILKTL